MRRHRSLVFTVVLAALAMGAGCAKKADRPVSTLTEAQRDSVIARSNLPGANVVGRALQVSGREASRATAMDTTVGAP